MPSKTELAIQCPQKTDLQHFTTDIQIDTMLTGDTGVTGTKRLIRIDRLLESDKTKKGRILQHHFREETVGAHLQSFQEDPSSKTTELYKNLQNNHQLDHGSKKPCPPKPNHQKTCICNRCAQNHDEICRQCNKVNHFISMCPKFLVSFCPDTMRISHIQFAEKYTGGRLLGKGGNGAVYAGFRNSDHCPVAIKIINKNRTLTGKTFTEN